MFVQCFVREILTTVQQLSYLILYVLIIILKVFHRIKQYCICWMRGNNDSFILQINMQVLWTEIGKDYLVSENGQPSLSPDVLTNQDLQKLNIIFIYICWIIFYWHNIPIKDKYDVTVRMQTLTWRTMYIWCTTHMDTSYLLKIIFMVIQSSQQLETICLL